MTRRERLEAAVGEVSDDIDRTEYIDRIEDVIDSRAGHFGWYAEHKHPADQAAEIEEAWRFQ